MNIFDTMMKRMITLFAHKPDIEIEESGARALQYLQGLSDGPQRLLRLRDTGAMRKQ